ncbi:anti-sigma factor family protein [Hyphobacterium sp.]|jgi:hypothetical protein|uniref:anti-sigma factor family protein n=1 Tax=Hyphobacterium sp. TaxID=2004662 RepID=UPI003BABEA14
MSWRDEDIMAYVDGEMPADVQARFEADLAGDEDLAARTERQRRIANRVRSHYAPIAHRAPPDRLTALLAQEAPPAGLLAQIRAWLTGPVAAPGLAAFASLALGIFVGAQFFAAGPGISGENPRAEARLASALDAAAGNADWQVPVTFRDTEGDYCRAFAAAEGDARGLACRDNEGWQVRLLLTAPAGETGGYQLASSALPPALLAEIDARMEGDPLDAESVAQAAAADWRE